MWNEKGKRRERKRKDQGGEGRLKKIVEEERRVNKTATETKAFLFIIVHI